MPEPFAAVFQPVKDELVFAKAFVVKAVATLAVWFAVDPDVEPFPLNVTVA